MLRTSLSHEIPSGVVCLPWTGGEEGTAGKGEGPSVRRKISKATAILSFAQDLTHFHFSYEF
jgi:hypothetical protein